MNTISKICLSVCILSFILVLFSFCTEHDSVSTDPLIKDEGESTAIPDNGEILVAYFSRANYVPEGTDGVTGATNKAGNTQSVAYYIKQQTNGEIFEIIPQRNYPVSHSECSAIAQQEIKDKARPALLSHVENMEKYSTIFVGFPIWVYREPMAVLSFLEEYNLKGKTVIPFCTSMAVSINQSMEDFKNLLSGVAIKQGLRLEYTLPENWQSDVDKWLTELNIKK